MARRKMKQNGICPHCNKKMQYENGEDGEITVFYWQCDCGRSYDEDGKDITDYTCTDVQ